MKKYDMMNRIGRCRVYEVNTNEEFYSCKAYECKSCTENLSKYWNVDHIECRIFDILTQIDGE